MAIINHFNPPISLHGLFYKVNLNDVTFKCQQALRLEYQNLKTESLMLSASDTGSKQGVEGTWSEVLLEKACRFKLTVIQSAKGVIKIDLVS